MLFSIAGLILDIVGVILLFIYGLPNKSVYNSILLDSSLSEQKEKSIFLWSKIGLLFLVLGFVFQIVGTIYMNK